MHATASGMVFSDAGLDTGAIAAPMGDINIATDGAVAATTGRIVFSDVGNDGGETVLPDAGGAVQGSIVFRTLEMAI